MKQKKIDRIEKAFFSLFKQTSIVTTLSVKNRLRGKYPKRSWKQKHISKVLIDLEIRDSRVTFTDNGTFRSYEFNKSNLPTAGSTMPNVVYTPTVVYKPKKVRKPKAKVLDGGKISKTTAVNMIKSNQGRFFTVTFIKADGKTKRTLNGNVRADNFMNAQGYINVRESNGNIRQINPRTITGLKIKGSQYTIK